MAKTGAIEKLKAMAKDRVDAKALKDFVAAGKDVPLSYKGREHVWAKKVKKFAEGGEAQMQAGGIAKLAKAMKGAKETPPAAETKIIQAPTVIVPSKLSNVKEAVRQSKGDYGARRVERAADEIPNLERMYKEEGLRSAFTGDNAQAMMTMNPANFEKFALPLVKSKGARSPMSSSGEVDKYTLPTDEYVEYLQGLRGGFSDVPLLGINKKEFGLPLKPFISAHEGRHRSRALAASGQPTSLVRLFPRAELREPFPRSTQEEYIQALRDELDLTGNLVMPEGGVGSAVVLPDIYAEGGEVKMAKGGEVHMKKGGEPVDPRFRTAGGDHLDEFVPPRYRRAGRRPESQQNREASANIPVAVARGLVSGTLGMPGDIESLVRIPYDYLRSPTMSELVTGDKTSKTILPTSEDIEKRLPFRSASQTPVGQMFTGASQLAGGFYTGPGSGARAVMAVPRAAVKAGRDFVQAAGQPAVNVIKPKGGNWLTGSVENALKPLKTKTVPQELADELGIGADNKAESAINNWIDRNLANYVRKEMATPEDPVRKLAEQGVLHIEPRGGAVRAHANRSVAGMPVDPTSTSPLARAWEDVSDAAVVGSPYKDFLRFDESMDEGLRRVGGEFAVKNPEARAYAIDDIGVATSNLGFDHIVDVLKQDLAAGRIRPEQLNKVSMEQAVRRTYDFDQDMAKRMREAQIKATEGMPVHKEYPEGYRWIELAQPETLPEGWRKGVGRDVVAPWGESMLPSDKRFPGKKALEDALKYEGDTMGHCVGGYCPDVMEGRSRIYSLRDAKGEPHVTVEVQPKQIKTWDDVTAAVGPQESQKLWKEFDDIGGYNMDNTDAAFDMFIKQKGIQPNQSIAQIKGKQNRAPNEEYLPFVQDFVRSGNWSDVGDIRNTGLRPTSDAFNETEQAFLRSKGVELKPYIDPEETARYQELFKRSSDASPEAGMKAGGEVKMQAGGIAKLKALLGGGAKPAKVEHPLVFPRAEPKTREEIRPIAQRVAEQMTGEFVRQNPKVTTNPAGKSRKQFEREKSIPLVTRNVVPERYVPPIDYEKFKDYAMVGVPGDASLGGVAKRGSLTENTKPTVELTQVGDIIPDQPVPLFGGPRFGNDEVFWASNADAATPIQNNVNALSELYDAPVLGKYIKMASDSANFALHNLDSLLAIQRPELLDRRKMEQLNELIRKGSQKYGDFPGFKGFEDPADVLLQSQLNSKLRKHIAETLTKPTITDAFGLPNGLDVVAAITHPQLRNLETGVSGFSVGRMTPGAALQRGESAHPTYDTDITGQLIFQNKYPTPYEIAFPDTTAYARSQLKPGVQEFNMMKLLGPRERIDQQYVDEMKTFEELMKQYTGKKKGGAVKSGLSSIKKV